MPDDGAGHRREPSDDDFRAAEEVLAQRMPSLQRSTPKYEKMRQALAMLRAEAGKDGFDLRYGLRKPRSSVEQMEADLFQGRVTEDQARDMLKADAERPIDVAMLDAFRDAYEERLLTYSQMLQTVVAIATDQRDPDSWRRRETEVDSHVAAMKAKLPLWKEQLATVFGFLAELQAERKGEPVRCGDHSAESAYMLAGRVMDQAAAGWYSCKEIAHRSRTDPHCSYATSASHLFFSSHMPGLPRPQDLQTLIVLEHARARKALGDRAASEPSEDTPATAKGPIKQSQDSFCQLHDAFRQAYATYGDSLIRILVGTPDMAKTPALLGPDHDPEICLTFLGGLIVKGKEVGLWVFGRKRPGTNGQAKDFLRLAKKAGAHLSETTLSGLGIAKRFGPASPWTIFVWKTLEDSPSKFVVQVDGRTILRNVFAASAAAIEMTGLALQGQPKPQEQDSSILLWRLEEIESSLDRLVPADHVHVVHALLDSAVNWKWGDHKDGENCSAVMANPATTQNPSEIMGWPRGELLYRYSHTRPVYLQPDGQLLFSLSRKPVCPYVIAVDDHSEVSLAAELSESAAWTTIRHFTFYYYTGEEKTCRTAFGLQLEKGIAEIERGLVVACAGFASMPRILSESDGHKDSDGWSNMLLWLAASGEHPLLEPYGFTGDLWPEWQSFMPARVFIDMGADWKTATRYAISVLRRRAEARETERKSPSTPASESPVPIPAGRGRPSRAVAVGQSGVSPAEIDSETDASGTVEERPEAINVGVIKRDGDHWWFTFEGKQTPPLDHRLGMEYLAWLLTHPGEEIAAVDLEKAARPAPRGVAKSLGELVEDKRTADGEWGPLREIRSESDVGEVYDRGGIEAVRGERSRLAGYLEAAEDPAKKAEIQEQIDALDKWRDANTDKYGRPRKVGDPAEKARKRVGKNITTALNQIKTHHEALWRHIDNSLTTTATILVYRASPGISWQRV